MGATDAEVVESGRHRLDLAPRGDLSASVVKKSLTAPQFGAGRRSFAKLLVAYD
jgi:hypothetical protein